MVEQDISMQGQFNGSNVEQQIAEAQGQELGQGQNPNEGQNEYTQIAGMISDLDRRLRILEERYGNLRKKVQLTDENLIDSERSINKELRDFSAEVLEVKRSISDFDEKIVIFSGEMDSVAQKTDLKVIEKYLAMWNPGMFVTRKELREYLKSKNIKVIEDSNDDSEEEQ
jgi:predicted  nucleic acid-binding Zn-ribbon protein